VHRSVINLHRVLDPTQTTDQAKEKKKEGGGRKKKKKREEKKEKKGKQIRSDPSTLLHQARPKETTKLE
jgi:hypothetical protein